MKRVRDEAASGRVAKANAKATRQPSATAAAPSFDLSRIAVHRSEVERKTAPPEVARSLASPSEALNTRFGVAFGDVRVHRGALANEAAASVGASAFTVGRHVVMGEGAREETLAHELVHAAQQGFGEPSGTLSLGDPHGANEAAADRGAQRLLGGAPLGPVAASPVQVARQPAPQTLHISIIGVGVAVPTKDQQRIVEAATKALAATTKGSSDSRIKAGVDIKYYQGLKDADALRKRGDIVVYVINAKKDDDRNAAVRDVLHSRGWDKDKHNKSTKADKLADDVLDLSQLLQRDRGVFHRMSGTSLVDISDVPKLDASADTSIAGTVLHEGVGHPAQLDDHGSHVMSAEAPGGAKPEDIVFDSGDQEKVNDYLKARLDTPDWDFK